MSDAPHAPVMKDELLAALAPRSGGVYVDATLGAGGHAEAILASADVQLVAIDRDPRALELGGARLEPFGERVRIARGRFGELGRLLDEAGVGQIDGLIADVGVSSMQLDEPERGLSFRSEGPLDMRMDPESGETALELCQRLDDDELATILWRYGEERRARRIARCIKQALAQGELATTLDLRRAVVRAVGPRRVGGIDPATRTFQALRIVVNDELGELTALLEQAAERIAPGGRIVVVSFHSLEDRIVKQALKQKSTWAPLHKKPLVASEAETERNPRARSAKLRAAERVLLPPPDRAEGWGGGYRT